MAEKPTAPLRRLSVDELPDSGGVLALPQRTARHFKVLRLGVGSKVRLVDGRGKRADAVVLSVETDTITCELSRVTHTPIPTRRVVLVQALPKGAKLETIVRMTTEIGVHAIHLAVCERSVARIKKSRFSLKIDRLRRIAMEACVQSEQAYSPEVYPAVDLLEAARRAPENAKRVVFWERSIQNLDDVLAASSGRFSQISSEVWAVVGPEGGLSLKEISALNALGYKDVGLGPSLLRVETAAPLVVGLLLDRLGGLRTDHSKNRG
jgi:16S rRNA (uracil1498-N3)-methyltransferase